MTSTPQVQLDLDEKQLDRQEKWWLRAANPGTPGAMVREVEPGVCYIALPCVGRLQRSQPLPVPYWLVALPGLAGVVFIGANAAGVPGSVLYRLFIGSVVGIFGLSAWRVVVARGKTERWTRDGNHGVLLTPDSMVLRRPSSVTRIARGGVLDIEDVTEEVDPYAHDEDRRGKRALRERVPMRRIRGRVSDGHSQFTVVFDEAEGRAQVLGASDGLPAEVRERMDTLALLLRRWHSGAA